MITVALAEDCIEHQTLLKQYLNQNPNFKLAHIANNGIEMVQYCHSLHPTDLPNVIIADYQMNPMDGLQLTQYLTTTFNGLKVLALSSHDHLYPIENMFACGAMGFKNKFFLASLYQNKPIQKEWLQSFYDAITTVANGNYFIDENLRTENSSNGFSFKTHSPTLLQQQQNKFTQNIIYKLGITEREYQVFYLYCCGFCDTKISTTLFIAKKTIHNHLAHIQQKLNSNNSKDLVMQAVRYRIIPSARHEYFENSGGGGKIYFNIKLH